MSFKAKWQILRVGSKQNVFTQNLQITAPLYSIFLINQIKASIQ